MNEKSNRRFDHKRINEYLYDENVPMALKNVYLMTLYIVPVVVIYLIISPFMKNGVPIIITLLAYMLLLLGLNYILIRFNEYKLVSYALCVFTCFFVFPVLFIISGHIYNGVPIYLAASVVLTFFVVKDKVVWLIAAMELAYYYALLLYSYNNRASLMVYVYDHCTFLEKVFNFLFACLVPVLIVFYQTELFYRIKEKKERSNISIRNSELSKIRFLANMTHEIRNPMNAIVGMNELILREELSPGAREQAEVIKDASAQLLRIVNNILIYSKLNSNKWEAVCVKYSFKDFITEVIDNVAKDIQEEGSDFYVFIDRNIPSWLFGDSQAVKQIFTYLLYNSVQQSQRMSMSLEILSERDASKHMQRFKCRIAENGSGMPEADVDSLLGAFNKYDSRRNATLKGLGLEISICNELLATMDGFLKIESVVGVGTAIIFEFSNYIIDDTPMLSVEESIDRRVLVYLNDKDEEIMWKRLMEDISINPVYAAGRVAFLNELENRRYTHIFIWEKSYEMLYDVISQAMCEDITYVITDYGHAYKDFGECKILRKPVSCLNIVSALNYEWDPNDYIRARYTERLTFPDANILVIDDSLVNQKVLSGLLVNFGARVKVASSGKAGLEILKDEEFDMILLDQFMPEMDGVETLRRIRMIPGRNSRIPVLCITAELGRDVHTRLIESGFDDYVAKPVKDYHLARLLRKYLPDEMMVIVTSEDTVSETGAVEANETVIPAVSLEPEDDPLTIDIEKGIENVGGLRDIYMSVLNTYYHEGLDKWKAIPEEFLSGDIPLFTTNVHALKSSSASVGAYVISERFKKLEFAGKADDTDYIRANLDETLEYFRALLESIREMLISEGEFSEASAGDEQLLDLDESSLDPNDILELKQSLASVNLKRCEEILGKLSSSNYGADINASIKLMRESYEMFDYNKVKETVDGLLDALEKGD
ncbi:MAG: response regulator [Lachnospiraceae bacterium]|nr:response regulator [Lachnospiraceae bacterium]